jgi:PAS domain-containing protein
LNAFRVLELLVTLASLLTIAGAAILVHRRDRLLAKVRQLAAQLDEGQAGASPTHIPESLGGVASALDQIGHRLAALRSTEQGRTEQALRLAQAVLEAMPDPVLVFDGEARITLFNTAAGTLFGAPLQIGATASALGDPVLQLAAEEASIGFPVASNRVPHVDLVDHGTKRRFRVRALPLPRSSSGAVVVLQDVTETDLEVDRLRHAAQSALFELRPLVDALGAALLQARSSGAPGIDEWGAIDAVLRDVEGSAGDQTLQKVDLAELVDSALDAISIEAQRRSVRIERQVDRPTPTPLTDAAATRRLLLRTLRMALRTRAEGEVLTVEVRGSPRPLVRIWPGAFEETPLDQVLLDRAQIVARTEPGKDGEPPATLLQFAQLG